MTERQNRFERVARTLVVAILGGSALVGCSKMDVSLGGGNGGAELQPQHFFEGLHGDGLASTAIYEKSKGTGAKENLPAELGWGSVPGDRYGISANTDACKVAMSAEKVGKPTEYWVYVLPPDAKADDATIQSTEPSFKQEAHGTDRTRKEMANKFTEAKQVECGKAVFKVLGATFSTE